MRKLYKFFGFLFGIGVFGICWMMQIFSSESRISAPILSKESGFYDDEFYLEMTSERGTTIYYTLDGSEPTEQDNRYVEPILIQDASSNPNKYSIMENTSGLDIWDAYDEYIPTQNVRKAWIIKARAYNSLGKASEVIEKVYWVGINQNTEYGNFPVLSLCVESEDFWGEEGIYTNGRGGNV